MFPKRLIALGVREHDFAIEHDDDKARTFELPTPELSAVEAVDCDDRSFDSNVDLAVFHALFYQDGSHLPLQ